MRAASHRSRRRTFGLGLVCSVLAAVGAACVSVTPESHLSRAPYLTAEFSDRVTVNWATDRAADDASLHWGLRPACRGHTTVATHTALTVRRQEQWQWRAD